MKEVIYLIFWIAFTLSIQAQYLKAFWPTDDDLEVIKFYNDNTGGLQGTKGWFLKQLILVSHGKNIIQAKAHLTECYLSEFL